MTSRSDILEDLSSQIDLIEGRVIVAIDGVDGAGKTTFANELAPVLARRGRAVLRASVDGFHNCRAIRYQKGKSDPEGFFHDSYNYAALTRFLLDPFRQGAPVVDVARYDHARDQKTSSTVQVATSAILLLDGIFLHRDELKDLWDFSVFLAVPFAVSYARMAERDGSNPDPMAPENRRYYQGQNIYLKLCQPEARASLVIDNSASGDALSATGNSNHLHKALKGGR